MVVPMRLAARTRRGEFNGAELAVVDMVVAAETVTAVCHAALGSPQLVAGDTDVPQRRRAVLAPARLGSLAESALPICPIPPGTVSRATYHAFPPAFTWL